VCGGAQASQLSRQILPRPTDARRHGGTVAPRLSLAVWLEGRVTIDFPQGSWPGWVAVFNQVESETPISTPDSG